MTTTVVHKVFTGHGHHHHVHIQHVLVHTIALTEVTKWWHYYLCALIGIGVTACLFVITDYYTSTRFSPVKSTAKASRATIRPVSES